MSLVVIDPAGRFHWRDRPANRDAVNAEVGEPGMALVRLHLAPTLYAFVNDCGLLLDPVAFPRNPVGACVIAALGANMAQPYAGPVVITGWDEWGESEISGLPAEDVTALRLLHGSVLTAIGGGESTRGAGWDSKIRDYARFVVDGPTPEIQIVHVDDFGRTTGGAL